MSTAWNRQERLDQIPRRIRKQRGGHTRSRYLADEDQASEVCYTLLGRLSRAPAPALQEQSLSRDAEEPRGFFDATVRFVERVADERLFERVDGGGQRLIEPQPNLGLNRRRQRSGRCGVRRECPATAATA